jgi:hypothetical protein
MKRNPFVIAGLTICLLFPYGGAYAGGKSAKVLADSVMRRIFFRDAARDALLPMTRIAKPRRVWRYTDKEGAKKALTKGLPKGVHTSVGISRGRALTSENARKRFGLAKRPDVRMTIELPGGHPVRRGKVIGGAPGVGEFTLGKPISPSAIKGMSPVPNAKHQ